MTDQILFDKLIYIDRLKRAGITDEQARAHAEAMDEALRDAVATKVDLRIAVKDLTIRMGAVAVTLFAALTAIKLFG